MVRSKIRKVFKSMLDSHHTNAKRNSLTRPDYTLYDLIAHYSLDEDFKRMWNEWVDSGDLKLKPTLRLILGSPTFTLDNLEVVSYGDFKSPDAGRSRRICTRCGVEKSLEEYYPRTVNGEFTGHLSTCKSCESISSAITRKTDNGLLRVMYGSQVTNSKSRGMTPPEYTSDEFVARWIDDSLFIKLHNAWEAASYDQKLRPSIDRIDDYVSYTWENTRMMTWNENVTLSYDKSLPGSNVDMCHPVIRLDPITLEELETYHSASAAGLSFGSIGCANIIRAMNTNTCNHGYRWKSGR